MWDRCSKHYQKSILSPFSIGPSFPLASDIEQLIQTWPSAPGQPGMVAIDCGCGVGSGLELIAGKVGIAVGIDWSAGMLSQTLSRLSNGGVPVSSASRSHDVQDRIRNLDPEAHETWLLEADLRDIAPLYGTADLVLTINSVISPSVHTSKAVLHSIASTLKSGGTFIGVLPSSDTMTYMSLLHLFHGKLRAAWRNRWRRSGVYFEQKYFSPREIVSLINKECGIRISRLEKVYYPWELIREMRQEYYPRWGETWDWYVVGEKE